MGANNTHDEKCEEKYRGFQIPPGEIYCNWTTDSHLCWPPTKAASTATQRCPKLRGFDVSKFVFKRCSVDGQWEGNDGNSTNPQGWTNYTTCFTPELTKLIKNLYYRSEDSAQAIVDIAQKTRTLEMVGFTVSLMALILSLIIFGKFTSLRNNRTRIHKNLFSAMVIQVLIRLILYVDQKIVRLSEKRASFAFPQGIENTITQKPICDKSEELKFYSRQYQTRGLSPLLMMYGRPNEIWLSLLALLCEASYILLEYARTAMFMWMFIEGLYLHNKVTVLVLHERSHYVIYNFIGWGAPVLLTAAWATTAALVMGKTMCWWNYNLNKTFWILEGPRMAVVVLNFLFLLNIIRILIVKLQQTRTSEIEQVRKAVRAAIVLVPLLGITNLIGMSEAPLTGEVWQFAIWSYLTHFLTSFQGFFIAFIYCFLNGEVRFAIHKSIALHFTFHKSRTNRRNSYLSGVPSVVDSPPEYENNVMLQDSQQIWPANRAALSKGIK